MAKTVQRNNYHLYEPYMHCIVIQPQENNKQLHKYEFPQYIIAMTEQ